MTQVRLYWTLGVLTLDGEPIGVIEPHDQWWRAPVGRLLNAAGYCMPARWYDLHVLKDAQVRRLPKRSDTDQVLEDHNRKAT